MVLLDSADSFFVELEQMFALCKQRGAGTVYTTLKKVEAGNKQQLKKGTCTETGGGRKAAGPGGRREGWLARAKISNQKARKISVLVRKRDEVTCFSSLPITAAAGVVFSEREDECHTWQKESQLVCVPCGESLLTRPTTWCAFGPHLWGAQLAADCWKNYLV